MEAHAADLRSEAIDANLVQAVKEGDWSALHDPVDRALAAYAVKLTRQPWTMTAGDLDSLRAVGLSDPAIQDAVQVIAYFNYINRVADGLGIDLEPGMAERPVNGN